MTRKLAHDLDSTLVALSDPTRRAILQRLSGGETRVTDLAEPFPISLNSVSKHVRALEKAGLVRRRKSGREYLLSIDTGPLDEAALWLTETRALWRFRLNRLASLLDDEDEAKRGAPRLRTTKGRNGK